jgi:hypothetical protein
MPRSSRSCWTAAEREQQFPILLGWHAPTHRFGQLVEDWILLGGCQLVLIRGVPGAHMLASSSWPSM